MMLTNPRFPWRRIQLAFAAVVMSFVAATTVADLSLQDVDAAASRIATQSSLAIEHLASARAELRRMQVLAALSLDRSTEGAAKVEPLVAARRRFDDEVSAYLALPSSQPQAHIRDRIERANGGLDAALEQLEHAIAQGDESGARHVMQEQLGRAADRASDALLAGVDVEAEQSAVLARRIAATRDRTRWLSVVLDVLGVLLAVAAAASVKSASRRYSELVEQNRQLLEKRAEELEMFASRVAHDVLGPLNPVAFALEMTRPRLPPGDPAHQWLDRASSSLRRIRGIVEGLLEFARAGAMPDPQAHADVASVVIDVLEGARPAAEAARIELSAEVDEAGEVRCGAGLVSTVVGNLVQNAIKYMQDAPVRKVLVRAEPRGTRLRLWVEDTGPGLPEHLARSIFDPYVRGHGGRVPGLGLGLATARRIIEAYGGHVGVESSPGRGCRFWIELPRVTSSSLTGMADQRPATA